MSTFVVAALHPRRLLQVSPAEAAGGARVIYSHAGTRPRAHAPVQVLRDTRHNGFPVVRDTPGGQVLVGLVNREHLMVILRRSLAAGARGDAGPGDVPYEDLNRHFVSAAARSLISEQQLAVLQVRAHAHAHSRLRCEAAPGARHGSGMVYCSPCRPLLRFPSRQVACLACSPFGLSAPPPAEHTVHVMLMYLETHRPRVRVLC